MATAATHPDAIAPPKPTDALGRYVSWVRVCEGPSFVYGGVTYLVDAAWVAGQVEAWRRLTDGGYLVPLLAGHDAAATRQERLGDVLELRASTAGSQSVLLAAVAWADPDAEDKIARGAYRYFSPRLSSLTDDKGRTYPLVLVELSVVAAPHQKRMGTTHVVAEETTMDPTAAPANPAAPTIEDRVATIESRLTALEAKLAAEPEEVAAAAEPPAADVAMAEQLRTLRADLATEQRMRRRAEFDARYPAGAVVTLTEELREPLFALREAAVVPLDRVMATAVRAASGMPGPAPAPRRSEIPWGLAMGEGAPAEAPAPETKEAMYKRLVAEKGSATAAIAEMKRLRPDA